MARKKFDIPDTVSKTADRVNKREFKTTAERIILINISEIYENPYNSYYSIDGIEELANSIERVGILQPIIVVKDLDNKKYKLISGHRRRLAFLELHKKEPDKWVDIPAIVKEFKTIEDEQIAIIEANRMREKSIEEITWEIQELKNNYKIKKERGDSDITDLTQMDFLVEKIKMSKTQIGRHNKIATNLIPELIEKYNDNKISISVADELSSLSQDKQEKLYKKTQGENITIPYIKDFFKNKKDKKTELKISIKYSEIEKYLPIEKMSKKEIKETILNLIKKETSENS